MDDPDYAPVPSREEVAAMTPLEAWDAAVQAAADIADWSAFWDDGQSAPRRIADLAFERGAGIEA